jgi:histidinol phosphatase-like enzyme
MNKQKIIAFDLDDVICFRPQKYENLGMKKYDYCEPNEEIIKLVNSLYDDNNIIIIYTARGMNQCKGDVDEVYEQLYNKTLYQLKLWNIKFHKLVMGKIHYDILIDDKALNSLEINKEKIDCFLKTYE